MIFCYKLFRCLAYYTKFSISIFAYICFTMVSVDCLLVVGFLKSCFAFNFFTCGTVKLQVEAHNLEGVSVFITLMDMKLANFVHYDIYGC